VDPENPEVPEFDGISFCQSLFHRLEKKIDQGSGEGTGDSRKFPGQTVDKIGFCQCVPFLKFSSILRERGHYFNNLARSSAFRCVYLFSICNVLCPVMALTSIGFNPFSKNRLVASWRRSWK